MPAFLIARTPKEQAPIYGSGIRVSFRPSTFNAVLRNSETNGFERKMTWRK
jgi:hypothetical protein